MDGMLLAASNCELCFTALHDVNSCVMLDSFTCLPCS